MMFWIVFILSVFPQAKVDKVCLENRLKQSQNPDSSGEKKVGLDTQTQILPEIKGIKLFKDNAGRPRWSPDNSKIAFHAKDKDGYYDIYVCDADGSNDTCLTCNHPNLPNKHIGQPSWSPSGEWIVFQAEKTHHALPKFGAFAVPGIGLDNDIYIMSSDGKKAYQLTNLKTKTKIGDPTPSCGILQPYFSHDGEKLSWAERIGAKGKWGEWCVRIADFVVIKGIPKLENILTFQPGENKHYYESNDFMPGDDSLLICGNLEKGQDEFGIDIYYLLPANGKTIRLTNTIDVFDECPHPSCDGKFIAYLSTEGYKQEKNLSWWEWAKGEFWLMNCDGSKKTQLTHFNTEGCPEYQGKRIIPANIAWSKDDKKILLGIVIEKKKNSLVDQIWLIELK